MNDLGFRQSCNYGSKEKIIYYLCIILKHDRILPLYNTMVLQTLHFCVSQQKNEKQFLRNIYARVLFLGKFRWRPMPLHILRSKLLAHTYALCGCG